jgi:hypothetical protein
MVSVTLVLFCAMCRGWTEIKPPGVGFIPYLFYRVKLGEVVEPHTGKTLLFSANDAGAAHSGNHWVWIEEYSVIYGRRLIVAGYASSSMEMQRIVREEPGVIKVEFVNDRYDNRPKMVVVRLK